MFYIIFVDTPFGTRNFFSSRLVNFGVEFSGSSKTLFLFGRDIVLPAKRRFGIAIKFCNQFLPVLCSRYEDIYLSAGFFLFFFDDCFHMNFKSSVGKFNTRLRCSYYNNNDCWSLGRFIWDPAVKPFDHKNRAPDRPNTSFEIQNKFRSFIFVFTRISWPQNSNTWLSSKKILNFYLKRYQNIHAIYSIIAIDKTINQMCSYNVHIGTYYNILLWNIWGHV